MDTIFTATLHEVAGDSANQSWIAKGNSQADAIRTSLKTLGFEYSEAPVDLTQHLFSVETRKDEEYETHSYRTAAQIRGIIGDIGLRLPPEETAKMEAFLAQPTPDEEYEFGGDGSGSGLKISADYSPGDAVGKR